MHPTLEDPSSMEGLLEDVLCMAACSSRLDVHKLPKLARKLHKEWTVRGPSWAGGNICNNKFISVNNNNNNNRTLVTLALCQ